MSETNFKIQESTPISEDEKKRREFEAKRRAHYDEFRVISEMMNNRSSSEENVKDAKNKKIL